MTTKQQFNVVGVLKLNPDRSLTYPEKYHRAKRLVITFPWAKEVINGTTAQWYYRHKKSGDEAYLPEGYASFKMEGEEEFYQIMEADGVTPAEWK